MTQAEFFREVMEARWSKTPTAHLPEPERISASALRMAYLYGAALELNTSLRAVEVIWPDDSVNVVSLDGGRFVG